MALPILNTPSFEVELPISKKTVKYRPFLVKEEKVLLMALESQDQKQIVKAMNDIVETCTFGEVQGKTLPVAELEYLFLKLRAKSVGENSTIGLKCKSCSTSNQITLNLEEIKLDVGQLAEKKIMLTDSVGIMMKYPTADDVLKNVDSKKSDIENTYSVIGACIETIFDTDSVHDVASLGKNEVSEFIDSLNKQQFAKIKEFFDALPKLKKDLEFKCEKCEESNHYSLEGMESFFV